MPRPASLLAALFLSLLAAGGAVLTAAPALAAQLLVGDTSIEASADSNVQGQAQAIQYTATASGTSQTISFYVDSSSTATAGVLGIYTTSGSDPGTLLQQATFTPAAGWNTVTLAGAAITSGVKYWLAELGTHGTLAFRDQGSGAYTPGSSSTTLTSLPATWTTGPGWHSGLASFYVSGASTGCSPGTPITITTGGTYSGCYTSAATGTPAVTIATTAPVTLSHATINHAGNAIWATGLVNLTVTDSTLTATNPGSTPVHQMDVYEDGPASLVFDHNQVTGGQGVLVNGEGRTVTPFDVSYNNYTNIGRYGQADWNAGAVHTQNVTIPGGAMDWNRITSHYGSSVSEDVFGLVQTNGTSAAPVDVSHNLVNGDYPYTGDGSSFTGEGIDLADLQGSYQNASYDTVVNYANAGLGSGTGAHIHYTNDTAVSDGYADNGARVNSTFGNGLTLWQQPGYPTSGPDIYVQNSTAGHLRWTGSAWERADFYLPACTPGACTGNTSLGTVDGAAEQSAITAFEGMVTAAGVTIGPRS